jgi:MscS family membrane protein
MERLSHFISDKVGIELWVAMIVAIALGTIAANYVAQLLLRQAIKASKKTTTAWDDALLRAANRPVLLTMWIIGASLMLPVFAEHFDFAVVDAARKVRDVLLIGCVTWFTLRFISRVIDNTVKLHKSEGKDFDLTTVDALGKLARILTVVIAVLIAAQTLGFKISGLLALGGVGGLAVGFAAKDLLANFFGGLTIYLDRPFGVGDWIRSPDKSIEGTVEYISWRHTRIRAFNKNPIYVPNSVFTTIVVENPSRMSHRRIKDTIGLRYDDFAVVGPVVAEIRDMLQKHPGIDSTQTLIVNFTEFGASSLDILIYTFTRTIVWTEYHEVRQDVLLRIGEIIERHGAQIAFPTQTLLLRRETPAET